MWIILSTSLHFLMFQEKPSSHQGTQHSTTWFRGSILPYTILSELYGSMQGLFLETTLVLLEEFTIQCCPVLYDSSCWYYVWSYILGQRRPTVCISCLSKNFFLLIFILFGFDTEKVFYWIIFSTETNSRTWSIFSELYMLRSCSLEWQMQLLYRPLCH